MDDADDAPTVAALKDDPDSILNTVKKVLALRHEQEDLKADGAFVPVCTEADKPFVYKRGNLICAVNPAGSTKEVKLPEAKDGKLLYLVGEAALSGGNLSMGAQSFAVFA